MRKQGTTHCRLNLARQLRHTKALLKEWKIELDWISWWYIVAPRFLWSKLRNFVVQPDFVKRVADFVRYKTNATWQIQLTAFLELDPDDGRRVWSPHDVSVIEAKFKGEKKAPLKREILGTFQQDPVLSHILEREGASHCYEKVKNLLRRSQQ